MQLNLSLLFKAMPFTICLVPFSIKGLNVHVKTCTSSTRGMKCGLTVTVATLQSKIATDYYYSGCRKHYSTVQSSQILLLNLEQA